mmetsp:Transcript_44884/g.98048  ORF Transcript_44884/g.98048 Transcript_44884/m.98048 type:complete len:476 (-) Transcript_44884:426-1853(-)
MRRHVHRADHPQHRGRQHSGDVGEHGQHGARADEVPGDDPRRGRLAQGDRLHGGPGHPEVAEAPGEGPVLHERREEPHEDDHPVPGAEQHDGHVRALLQGGGARAPAREPLHEDRSALQGPGGGEAQRDEDRVAPGGAHEAGRLLLEPPLPADERGDADVLVRLGRDRAQHARHGAPDELAADLLPVQPQEPGHPRRRLLQRHPELLRPAEGPLARPEVHGRDLPLRPGLRRHLAPEQDGHRVRLGLQRRPPALLGRAQHVGDHRRAGPHGRREGGAEDDRRRLAGVDAGGGADEVPRGHGARPDPGREQEAEEARGARHLVRPGGARRLRQALRPRLRREAQPVPPEVLPLGRRLVREDVDGGAEGAHAPDAVLPLVPDRRRVEPYARRRLLPLSAGRQAGHLGLLLPDERGVAVAEDLGGLADDAERAVRGLLHRSRRRRRLRHAHAALRRPRPAGSQREEPPGPDLRPGDET